MRSKGQGAANTYEAIKDRILSFQLQPSTQLSESALAQEIQVSRTIVREALQHLEDDGLIEKTGQRWTVTAMTEKDIYEICQVREALECKAVEVILKNGGLTPGQIRNLRQINECSYQSDDYVLNYSMDGRFHATLCEYSNNSRLIAYFDKLALQMERTRWLTMVLPKNDPRKEHEQIIKALEENDLVKARDSVEKHLRSAEKNFVKIFSDDTLWCAYNSFKSFISEK